MVKNTPQKTPLVFYRSSSKEPVREWLKALDAPDRLAVGQDLMRARWRWPVGMPLCRAMGQGLWEIRTELPSKRIARVLLCLDDAWMKASSWRCMPSSRRRRRRPTASWHWRASARRS